MEDIGSWMNIFCIFWTCILSRKSIPRYLSPITTNEEPVTHPVPIFSPPAWISSLHDGWRSQKRNTNCKGVADGPPSHASLCTGLLSCRSVSLSTPPTPVWSRRATAASLSTDRDKSDRKVLATLGRATGTNRDTHQTTMSERVVRADFRIRTARPVVSSSLASPLIRRRSIRPSVRLGSWRASDLSSDSAEEASPVLRVSFFSATLSSTLATLSLSPPPGFPRVLLLYLPAPFAVPLFSSPTPPPSLHRLLFRPLLPPLHVATGTTTTVRDTTTAVTASTAPPPPPSPGLPHLRSRPGGFPTT